MADEKISGLATASTPDGSELVEIVQGGTNKKTTTQAIADLGGGAALTDGSGTTANGTAVDLGGAVSGDVAVVSTNGHTMQFTSVDGSGDGGSINIDPSGGGASLLAIAGSSPTAGIQFNTDGTADLTLDAALAINGNDGTAGQMPMSRGAGTPPTWEGGTTASGLTDGASVTITGPLHSLATDEATITFTISYVGPYTTTVITLTGTTATYTFAAGSLCMFNGTPTGDNTVTITGTTGDKYVMVTQKIGSIFYVAVANFGQ